MVEESYLRDLVRDFPDHVQIEGQITLIGMEILDVALARAEKTGLRLAGADGFKSDPSGTRPMLDFILDLSWMIQQDSAIADQYEAAHRVLANWKDGPDFVELVFLEPLA